MGVIRVVLVRLRAEHVGRAGAIIDAAREVFPTIPGVVDFEAGVAAEGWHVLLLVHFEHASAVEPYRLHPIHIRFRDDHLVPWMEALEAWNFEV